MKKSILEVLERILEATLSALASLGMFLFVTFLINLFWDGTLTIENMLATFAASLLFVYCMNRALVKVQCELVMLTVEQRKGAEDGKA